MSARSVRVSVQSWPPSTMLLSVAVPIVGDSAVVPVRDCIRQVWARLPALVAAAQPTDRFVLSIGLTQEEVDIYVAHNITVHALLTTVARKLVKQSLTAAASEQALEVVELHGTNAESVLADLAAVRGVIPWLDPFERR